MDGDILEARHKTIIEQLPSWCLKLATEEQPVTVGLEKIRDDKKRVSFNCRCGRVRVEHRCKNNGPVAVGMALARKCEEKHGTCSVINPSVWGDLIVARCLGAASATKDTQV